MNKRIKWPQKDLIIQVDDDDLKKVSEIFLEDIELNFRKFQEDLKTNKKIWGKYENRQDFNFFPEKIVKKSPLTIISAPWGTGKTFFIENFMKLFCDKKISSEVFEKMMIVDAWKFSNSRDIPFEFLKELTGVLVRLNSEDLTIVKEETKWIVFKKLVKKIGPFSISLGVNFGLFNAGFNKDFNEETNGEKDDTEMANKLWKLISENNKKIIIFIDNLERLGPLYWDLLKAILRIQDFPNYLIILPLNINKIVDNRRVDELEYPIEKYIDFNVYNFKQDYYNYFKNCGFDNVFIRKLNSIFDTEIDGEKLSIREVEKSIKKHDINKTDDEYLIIGKIHKNIWPSAEIPKILKEDLSSVIKFEKSQMNMYIQICEVLLEATSCPKNNLFLKEDYEKVPLINVKQNNRFWYSFGKSYKNDIHKTILLMHSKNQNLNSEYNKNSEKISLLEKEREILIEKIDKQKAIKIKLEKSRREEHLKEDEKALREEALLKEGIASAEKKITNWQKSIDDKIQMIDALTNSNDNLSTHINLVKQVIEKTEKLSEDYEKMILPENLSISKKEKIVNTLRIKITNVDQEFEKDSNFEQTAEKFVMDFIN